MPTTIKYFNAFVLKKTVNNATSGRAAYSPVFSGLPSNPSFYPIFPTSAASPVGRTKPVSSVVDNERNWIIEESRIKGGYNEVEVGLGVRAFLRKDTNEQRHRFNSLIYSGVFNSLTSVNDTNVFPTGEPITKSVDPYYGSIQKLHTLDNNLAILQENKVSRALIDKDEIYSAEGGGTITSSNAVIGQVTPYVGEYGISTNPESFAYFGYRRYFTDKYRNAIMRLSRDGLTEISQYGMKDFFRDKLGEINSGLNTITFTTTYLGTSSGTTPNIRVTGSNTSKISKGMLVQIPQISGASSIAYVVGLFGSSFSNNVTVFLDRNSGSPSGSEVTFTSYTKDKIVGGYDNYNSNYVVSLQKETNFQTETTSQENVSTNYYTLAFDEGANGWVSFFSYKPKFLGSLKNVYFTFNKPDIYQHYSNNISIARNNFYGVTYNSNITFVFNPAPSAVKTFKTINYEGSNGWQVDSFISDSTGSLGSATFFDQANPVKSYEEGLYYTDGIPNRAGFYLKQSKYYANLVNNSSGSSGVSGSFPQPGEVFFGNATSGIKGFLATVKLSTDTVTDPGGLKELFAVSSEFVRSN